MKIADLKHNKYKNVTVEGTIEEISEVREVTTRLGEKVKLAKAKLSDETGSVSLVLWGKQTQEFNVGDKVKVDGFVNQFKGELQLTTGKRGKIEKL